MTIAFIADLHLSSQRPRAVEMFTQFLRRGAAKLEQIYILGDLFDYWVGDDGAGALGHEKVELELRAATEKGARIFFMRGNRDFLIGEDFARRANCELLPDPAVIEPGRRLLLTHGDALCTDDREHQESRGKMLSEKWKRVFLEKPLDARMQTAAEMRAQSEAGKLQKDMKIMDVNQGAVEELMLRHRADVLIHGHTHRPAVHQFELAGKPAWRYVLGDWFDGRSAAYYAGGKLALRK
ncbi:MAG: UDP-2,3-diacylglucosamine diphosphatase [Gammaproteobacteria bacterium]|nr:UDP-2,3-diacylglucosamine diphosphatase [Gammaproteobacteria bacterium]